jgi:arginine deiminase
VRASQPAEWDKARVVLLCQPSTETLFAILETNSANFLYPFDLKKAIEEHRNYRRKLEEFGAKVYDVREMLINKCDDPGNLRRLREFALNSVKYAFEGISNEDREQLLSNLRRTIDVLSPEVLADIIILRPIINIRYNPRALDPTTRFLSSYCLDPANNLYFMRDGMLTTKEGVVIGNFTLDVRKIENDIVELALRQMGIEPIYRVREPGHAEGGDFMPAGDFVLQGVGLLSDEDGVKQMLDNGVYGNVEVALVRDPTPGMEEMHLDTYFNFLGSKLALLSEDRMIEGREPSVEIFEPVAEERVSYKRRGKMTLKKYLEEKGFEIFKITVEEQRNFAPNFLLLEEKRIIGVKQAGESFEERLKEYGVKADLLDFSALTGGYGGPHCMSQVILRE